VELEEQRAAGGQVAEAGRDDALRLLRDIVAEAPARRRRH
jgi:hypothetical protein